MHTRCTSVALLVGTTAIAWLSLGAATAASDPFAHGALKRRVSIDVHDAEIANVLRLLSESGGFNLVLDDDVGGKVSMRLRDVRLGRALAAVLKSRGLAAEWSGNILRVAHAQTLLREERDRYQSDRAYVDGAPLKTWFIPVNNAKATDLLPHVRSTLTKRGSASADERSNIIIIRDVDLRYRR